jgi:hypothetical protein
MASGQPVRYSARENRLQYVFAFANLKKDIAHGHRSIMPDFFTLQA